MTNKNKPDAQAGAEYAELQQPSDTSLTYDLVVSVQDERYKPIAGAQVKFGN